MFYGSIEKQYETTTINGKRQTLCIQKLTDVGIRNINFEKS